MSFQELPDARTQPCVYEFAGILSSGKLRWVWLHMTGGMDESPHREASPLGQASGAIGPLKYGDAHCAVVLDWRACWLYIGDRNCSVLLRPLGSFPLPFPEGMNRIAIDTSDSKASFELLLGDLFEIDVCIPRAGRS
jgi:hypothetical protein